MAIAVGACASTQTAPLGVLPEASVPALAAAAVLPEGDWRTINRDLAATRYSPLNEINRANVAGLQQVWAYPMRGYNTAVPLVIDGVMYFPAGNRVIALDAASGQEIWTFEQPRDADNPRNTISGRGVGYWPGDAQHAPRIVVMIGSGLLQLDAATGQPVQAFGEGGYIDVGVPYGGTPTIYDNVAIIGAATMENPIGPPGNPRAFDLLTGAKLWEFQTVPQEGQPYNETWGNGWKGRSGANMWAFMAPVDTQRGIAYLPISSAAPNYWRGDAPGSNLFSNSLVAVDAKTGKYLWHFQTVHHDLWDADMPSAGSLINVTIDGETKPIIAHVGKTSYFFELNRVTGEPVLPVEERPVPRGDVPGEYYHPTQPFPVKTPPLSRVSMTKADMVTAQDTTAEHAAACQAMWDKAGGFYNVGPFTPFLFQERGAPPRSTIQLPGGIGGVNWGGPAADPTTGMVYVNAHDTSLVGWVEKVEPGVQYSFDATETAEYDRASVDGKGPFFSFSAPISGKYDEKARPVGPTAPCYKGPWARLTAVDANTGEIKWAVPLGLVEGLPEDRQLQGDTGSAGPTVTAGGLVFVGATNDKRFRAFDATTGKQLWEARLDNSANANPMSYRARSGKQYVAINAGGTMIAYALPGQGS
ncbi:PQQ-binding-like beta-propeller repeat protein [Altericroceibacterium xinjiangense]|uniref:outer membrane protein assembly factor BamB family protein n=1 Tax=Altericroceibacterium xinjiangense TaxID=762261 RepID=UPI0013E0A4C1|nr:PQQ-binding-like beta-propeller repeat protein [Altericroceibacterium xinjiangense]